MKNQFEIQVPFFCGFYESPLYNSDTLYCEVHDEDNLEYYKGRFDDDTLTEDDLDIDFKAYKTDCCKVYIDAFYNSMDCPDFIESMEFVELSSPRYYNFETDRLFAKVTLSENWRDKVKEFMDENKEWLTDRIAAEWTSRDGFLSYIDNTYDYWYNELQKDEPDVRYLSAMIGYMMLMENKDIYYDLIMDTLDSLYINEYIINLKEQKDNSVAAE